jgi:diadenylate cyclase
MFELFKIGFMSFTFIDLIDIAVVSFIIYKIYTIIKGTIAAQIFLGLIVVLFFSFIAQAGNFKALGWLLKLVTDIWVIAFIILFQPEIRRFLLLLGKKPFGARFYKGAKADTEVPDILTEAAFEMSQHQHGALIVLERTIGIRSFIDTGEPINAHVSVNLLRSIFFPRSPLHDGAVIMKDNIILAARCTLPLSSQTSFDNMPLGMRHRAGLGITEQTDVICLIVSEETGSISIAEEGKLYRGLSRESVRKYLTKRLEPEPKKGVKSIFELFGKSK